MNEVTKGCLTQIKQKKKEELIYEQKSTAPKRTEGASMEKI